MYVEYKSLGQRTTLKKTPIAYVLIRQQGAMNCEKSAVLLEGLTVLSQIIGGDLAHCISPLAGVFLDKCSSWD